MKRFIATRHLLFLSFMLTTIGACGLRESETKKVIPVRKTVGYGGYVVSSGNKELVISGDSQEGNGLREIFENLDTYGGVMPREAFKRDLMNPDVIFVRYYAEWPRKQGVPMTASFAWFLTTPPFIAAKGESGENVDVVQRNHAAVMEQVLASYDESAKPVEH